MSTLDAIRGRVALARALSGHRDEASHGAEWDRDVLLAAVDAVLALHEHRTGKWFDHEGREWHGESCAECRDDWPCPTAHVVTEALGADR